MRRMGDRRPACCPLVLVLVLVPALILTPAATADEWVYVVEPGDNLWVFSERYLDTVMRYEQLLRINNIERPRSMPPGTRIRVPMEWIESNPVPATVQALAGSVSLLRASGERGDAREGMQLFLGDGVRTDAQGSVAVLFADGSRLTVYPDSEVRFNHLSAYGETGMVDSQMNLLRGRIDTRVTPSAGPGSRFEIQTPSAISAVRGTEYRAAVVGDARASNIEVTAGTVDVGGASAREAVGGGFGTRVEPGGEPLPPRKLLPAPRLQPLPFPVRGLGEPVSWAAVDRAAGYRVEVSASADFATLAWSAVATQSSARLPDLADGRYHLRVRAIDALGLEGYDSVLPLELDVRPLAPRVLGPADVDRASGAVTLTWEASADATSYRLELARDAGFTELVRVEETTPDTHLDLGDLPAFDEYFWRVTSVDVSGEAGPPGSASRFEVQPPPEEVDLWPFFLTVLGAALL